LIERVTGSEKPKEKVKADNGCKFFHICMNSFEGNNFKPMPTVFLKKRF
jgi:hypothetical protein